MSSVSSDHLRLARLITTRKTSRHVYTFIPTSTTVFTNAFFIWCIGPSSSDGWDLESRYEPDGSTPITTDSISKCASF